MKKLKDLFKRKPKSSERPVSDIYKVFKLSRLNECDSFNDNHVIAFFLQLVMLLTVFFVLGSALIQSSYPEAYDSEKGQFGSYIALFESHGIEYKELTPVEGVIASIIGNVEMREKYPTLGEETDKFIDIKNHGVWLNEGQSYIASDFFYSMLICGVICLIIGWGSLFQVLRVGAGICLVGAVECIVSIIGIPFSVIPLLGFAILVVLAGFAYPVIIAINLVLGIIQIIMTITSKGKNKSTSAELQDENDWKTA